MIANTASGTNVHEIADGIDRINTPMSVPGGQFSFNQSLIADDEPLLFHLGQRHLFGAALLRGLAAALAGQRAAS